MSLGRSQFLKRKRTGVACQQEKLIEQTLAKKADQENNDSFGNDQEEESASNFNKEEPEDTDNIPADDDRFGQAVSLNELTKVGNLLQQENLDAAQEKETSDIIQKLRERSF
jgi:hypothetical protein